MDKANALESVRAYKDLIKPYFPIEKVILFGSFARGTQRDDSDIDVAVIVDKLTDDDFFASRSLLWKLRRAIDIRIEPVLIEREADPLGFIRQIEKEGVEV